MDAISSRAEAYFYIGGLQNGIIQTDLIPNRKYSKYTSLVSIQLDADNI